MRFGGYELIEKIGVGGMAEVFRARTLSTEGVERTLVIKKILPEFAANQTFIRMLVAEARVSSLLNHANIVQIFELGEIDGQYYIAMEYVPGPDLLAVLTAATRAGLRVPLGIALFIISEICNGLAAAHRATDTSGRPLNLIHRDISPSNILISDQGAVKLMDFGVASADLSRPGRPRAVDTSGGTLKGKLGYMAPEQVSSRPVDHRADLFALGIVLFETLTLKRLFLGASDPETLANIRNARLEPKLERHPYIPEGVQLILRRALARNPDERYADAGAFRDALLDCLFEQRISVTNRKLARFLSDLDWRAVNRRGEPSPPTAEPQPMAEAAPTLPPTADPSKATFELRQVDGRALPPIDFDDLQGLMHRQAVTHDELVRVNGGPWTPLDQILTPRDFPPQRPTGARLREGPVNRLTLPTLLHELIVSAATVTLHLSHRTRTKTVYFQRGVPVGAESTDPRERLGHYMLTRGMLSADELAQAIITSAERNLRLGDALVADGTVQPHALVEVLSDQLRARFVELLGWEHGWYVVHDGAEMRDSVPLDTLDGLELLALGLRTHLDLPTLERLFSEQMTREIVPLQPPGAPTLPFTPAESRQLSRIPASASLQAILEGLDDEARHLTLRVLFAQQRTGHIALRATAAAHEVS